MMYLYAHLKHTPLFCYMHPAITLEGTLTWDLLITFYYYLTTVTFLFPAFTWSDLLRLVFSIPLVAPND